MNVTEIPRSKMSMRRAKQVFPGTEDAPLLVQTPSGKLHRVTGFRIVYSGEDRCLVICTPAKRRKKS